MSNRRSIFYLLFLLLLAVGANLWLDIAGEDHGEVVRRKSLVGDADVATALEVAAGDGPAIRLERTDRWRIVSPFRAVADQTAVARLTDALAFAPVLASHDEADTRRLGNPADAFGLERPRTVLKVVTARRETVVNLGRKVEAREEVYASVRGFPVVFVVPSSVYEAASLPVDAWRRRTVFGIAPDEVVSMDIRRGDTPAERLVRKGERWEVVEPNPAPASAAAVRRILDTVLACEARRFVWPVGASNETATASVALLAGYGLDPETCDTAVFRTADGRDHTISFGNVAESGEVFALVHGGTAVATVAAGAKAALAPESGTLADGRLFPLEKPAVRRISMVDGDVAYLLARGDDGRWRLDSPVSAAADEVAVGALVDRLLVMRNSDLDEGGVRVSLATNAVPVAVSRAALLGSGGFEEFRSRVVFDVDPATVRRIVISRAGDAKPQAVVFDPDRKGWNVDASGAAGVIDPDRLNAVLAALARLEARSVARLRVSSGEFARYGLETPSCTIAVDRLLEGSIRRNLLVGNALNPGGDAYATVGASDAVFVLDGATVGTLLAGVFAE